MLLYPKTFIYLYLHSTKNKCQLQPMQQIQSLVESCETQEFSFRVLKPEASTPEQKQVELYTSLCCIDRILHSARYTYIMINKHT